MVTDVAIGYVRKRLEEFKDHPKLLGDIARYYYESGQQRLQFVDQLKKIKVITKTEYRSL